MNNTDCQKTLLTDSNRQIPFWLLIIIYHTKIQFLYESHYLFREVCGFLCQNMFCPQVGFTHILFDFTICLLDPYPDISAKMNTNGEHLWIIIYLLAIFCVEWVWNIPYCLPNIFVIYVVVFTFYLFMARRVHLYLIPLLACKFHLHV